MNSFKKFFMMRSLTESAPSAKFGSDDLHEVRKVPIFLDEDDIRYLEQFPPDLWRQALVYRYNTALKEHAKNRGDVRNVILDTNKGKVLFKNINTSSRKLHQKLTHPSDDTFLRNNPLNDQNKAQYKAGNHGAYNFDLSDPTSHPDPDLTVFNGMVGFSRRTAGNVLQRWMEGMKHNWLGTPETHSHRRPVPMGGRAHKNQYGTSTMPVYSEEELSKKNIKRYGITGDGQRVWQAYLLDKNNKPVMDDNGEPKTVRFVSYLPKMAPAQMIDAKAHSAYNKNYHIARTLHQDLNKLNNPSTSEDIKNLYAAIYDDEKWKKLSLELQKLERELQDKIGDKKQLKRSSPNKVLGQEIAALKRKRDRLEFVNDLRLKIRQGGLSEQEKEYFLNPENLEHLLTIGIGRARHKAETIQKAAKRYDVYDWNFHHFSADEKGLANKAYGMGTADVNKQQRGQYHSGVADNIQAIFNLMASTKRGVVERSVNQFINKIPNDTLKAAMESEKDDLISNAMFYIRGAGLGGRKNLGNWAVIQNKLMKATTAKEKHDAEIEAYEIKKKVDAEISYLARQYMIMISQFKNRENANVNLSDALEEEDERIANSVVWNRFHRKNLQQDQSGHAIAELKKYIAEEIAMFDTAHPDLADEPQQLKIAHGAIKYSMFKNYFINMRKDDAEFKNNPERLRDMAKDAAFIAMKSDNIAAPGMPAKSNWHEDFYRELNNHIENNFEDKAEIARFLNAELVKPEHNPKEKDIILKIMKERGIATPQVPVAKPNVPVVKQPVPVKPVVPPQTPRLPPQQ